jgi:hypothetical protein
MQGCRYCAGLLGPTAIFREYTGLLLTRSTVLYIGRLFALGVYLMKLGRATVVENHRVVQLAFPRL